MSLDLSTLSTNLFAAVLLNTLYFTPNECKILELDEKLQQTNKQTITQINKQTNKDVAT